MQTQSVEDSFTRHGRVRSAQRSIPPQVVEWLLDFGTARPMRDAEYVFFDRKARERLRRHLGAPVVDRLGKLLDVYAVRGRDGSVLTVAHRLKRIPND